MKDGVGPYPQVRIRIPGLYCDHGGAGGRAQVGLGETPSIPVARGARKFPQSKHRLAALDDVGEDARPTEECDTTKSAPAA